MNIDTAYQLGPRINKKRAEMEGERYQEITDMILRERRKKLVKIKIEEQIQEEMRLARIKAKELRD